LVIDPSAACCRFETQEKESAHLLPNPSIACIQSAILAVMVESRGAQVNGITYTFVIISSIATLLRIYCRVWVMKAFALDDWLAVAAQVCCDYSCQFIRTH
jgi:hypothetical protein